jgi:hypothetical protein
VVTNLLERVPTEEIRAEADRIRPGRLLVTLLVGVFYAIGWTAGKASLGLRFSMAAVKVGWQESRGEASGRLRGVG